MPQRCTICTREDAKKINSQVAQGGSLRNIAKQFKVTASSLYRHTETCLKTDISALVRQSKEEQMFDFHETMRTLMTKSNKIGAALEEWLADPDDPEKFDVSPRGDELTVIYLDWKDTNNQGEPKRKKASLQTLLNRVESPGAFEPVSIMSQAVDNRKLYLDTVRLFGDQLDRFAKHFPPEDKKPLTAEDKVRVLYKISRDKYALEHDETIDTLSRMFPNLDVRRLIGTNAE